MKDKYGTTLFDVPSDEYATMGYVRQALIEIYGLDKDYVYAYQEDNGSQQVEVEMQHSRTLCVL